MLKKRSTQPEASLEDVRTLTLYSQENLLLLVLTSLREPPLGSWADYMTEGRVRNTFRRRRQGYF